MRYRLLVGYQTALKATVSVSAMVWIINILQRFMCSQHYTKGLSNWGVEASRRKSGLWVTLKGIWIPSFLFDSWPPWRKQTVVTTDSHLGILPCQSPPLNKPSKPWLKTQTSGVNYPPSFVIVVIAVAVGLRDSLTHPRLLLNLASPQDRLEVVVLLYHLPLCWDHRHAPTNTPGPSPFQEYCESDEKETLETSIIV